MHRGMADMMKAMGKGGKRGPMAGLGQMLGFGGGAAPSPEQLAEIAKNMPGGGLPPGLPGGGGLPPTMPKLPPNMPGLPGLGGKFPGPGGLPGFGKKK
jgi:signal recognition particle subunit SRP54